MNDESKDVLLFAARNLAAEALDVWRRIERQRAFHLDSDVEQAKKIYEQAMALVKTLEAMW